MTFDRWLLRILPIVMGGSVLVVFLRHQAAVNDSPGPPAIAVAHSQADFSAEDTFRRIEETIEKAKTLRIRFTWEEEGAREDVGRSGALLIKTGNKAWVHMKTSSRRERCSVSNGTETWERSTRGLYDEGIAPGDGKMETGRAPKDLERSLRRLLTRPELGFYRYSNLALFSEVAGTSTWTRAYGFELGEMEGKTRTLSYHLATKGGTSTMDVTLWYDRESLQLRRRRTVTVHGSQKPMTLMETYSEFIFDTDIPDEMFKLLHEK